MSERRFPPAWTVETIPGGLKVCDANGQSLAYVYSRENPNDAHMAKVLTKDEARRIASNIAKLPTLLGKAGRQLRSARAWQQCHTEQDSWKTLRLRALKMRSNALSDWATPR